MASIPARLKPKVGFSNLLHVSLNVILPFAVFVLVRIGFSELALLLILSSKWRMLAVRPRYWLTNLRSNSVDIIIGVSIFIFMIHTGSYLWQLLWMLAYIVWLVFLKPGSNILLVSIQAFIGEFMGLMAIFLWLSGAPLYQLIIATWLVCYLSARHYFTIFEESFSSLYAHTWGYFAAALTWVLGHWLLFYGVFSQPTVILAALSLGFGSLYYLRQLDRLNKLLRRQIVLVVMAIIVVILAFSNWSSKVV